MKLTLTTLLCIISQSTFANFSHAPKSFETKDGLAIFTDFTEAEHSITYNPQTKKVTSRSKIIFESFEDGLPLWDMIETPSQVILDGEEVKAQSIKSPDKETSYKIALKTIPAGTHTLEIISPINSGINFTNEGVSSAFWFNDLDDRSFLEAYLPANLEFDQYPITFNLDFQTLTKQKIYTNGFVTQIDDSKFKVLFPKTYTSSSLYFHTAPIGRYPEKRFNFQSMNGKNIPVTAYASSSMTNLETVKKNTLANMEKLESMYGPFLHDTLTVFIAGSGGMEYAGATMTSMSALNHELTHSYFARGGLMPANGNAGWLDEAITSWSDEGTTSRPNIGGVYSNMAGNSQYRRYTHGDAYTYGKSFMAHLNYKFQNKGGLNSFLNQLILTDSFVPMTTEEFIKKISGFYSEDLTELFKKHTYSEDASNSEATRHVHMKMTIEEMKEFL
jgi:hypothetical protein